VKLSAIYCFTSAINPEYLCYPCYHSLIVDRHPYLFSSIGTQPLLKLSSNSNSVVTMANCRKHAYLLTVLFHSSRAILYNTRLAPYNFQSADYALPSPLNTAIHLFTGLYWLQFCTVLYRWPYSRIKLGNYISDTLRRLVIAVANIRLTNP